MDDRQFARFTQKYRVSPDGCWLWQGYLKPNGYAQFFLRKVQGKTVIGYAHRVSYEHFVGPLPKAREGAWLELDHLCRVRHCVNPDHLELVTRRENVLRSESLAAHHAKKSACPKGHPYSGKNIRGERICRTCVNERQRTPEYREKHAADERERRRRKRESY